MLVDHFLVDAEEMFCAAADLRLYPRLINLFLYVGDDLRDNGNSLGFLLVDLTDQFPVGLRFQIFQTQIVLILNLII
jgi:hypothetical protein